MIGLKVEDLRRDAKGHYRAVVVNGDVRVPVNRRWGCWQTDAPQQREVQRPVAAWLQDLVRKLERQERQGQVR